MYHWDLYSDCRNMAGRKLIVKQPRERALAETIPSLLRRCILSQSNCNIEATNIVLQRTAYYLAQC